MNRGQPPAFSSRRQDYRAQILHYGLDGPKAPSTDRVKTILLQAFAKSGGTFKVPEKILQMETETKEQCEKDNLVAKKVDEEEKRLKAAAEMEKKMKRKPEADESMAEVLGPTSKKIHRFKGTSRCPDAGAGAGAG